MKQIIFVYLSVGIGGMVGASLRFLLGQSIKTEGTLFPWETLIVNLSGAFFLSFILFLPIIKTLVPTNILLGITTGVLGAYTTFSTLIIEIVQLFEHHSILAILYVLSSFFGGLTCSFFGYHIARSLVKGSRRV